jgi:hypothetical protein
MDLVAVQRLALPNLVSHIAWMQSRLGTKVSQLSMVLSRSIALFRTAGLNKSLLLRLQISCCFISWFSTVVGSGFRTSHGIAIESPPMFSASPSHRITLNVRNYHSTHGTLPFSSVFFKSCPPGSLLFGIHIWLEQRPPPFLGLCANFQQTHLHIA